MNEIEQLNMILSSEVRFWEDDGCRSYAINQAGGIKVEVTENSGVWQWKVIWPDRSEKTSDQSLYSFQDAKNDLRDFLTQRVSDLDDATMPLAKSEILPS